MTIKIYEVPSQKEVLISGTEFVLEENQTYKAEDFTGTFQESNFRSLGTFVSPNIGLISVTNKVGLYHLNGSQIRIQSKLGDRFFTQIKEKIATIEKQLLLSSNGAEEEFSLTNGRFLEKVALSVFLKSWDEGLISTSLNFIYANPSCSLKTNVIEKNLAKGDFIAENDFMQMQNQPTEFTTHVGKIIPLKYKTKNLVESYDVLEMRFIKFFLQFSSNLLSRTINSSALQVIELDKQIIRISQGESSDKAAKISSIRRKLVTVSEESKRITKILRKLRFFLKSNIFINVENDKFFDLTSLKLHKNFHFKRVLSTYIRMRKSFETLANDHFVFLNINSLENLYEYYCLIMILSDFNIEKETILSLVQKRKDGWFIDKAQTITLLEADDYSLVFNFQKVFSKGKGSHSQTYDPDYTLTAKFKCGEVKYILLDAKYKHNNGFVKKEDIDKMHTYTHAIKGAIAAFAVFPGYEDVTYDCGNSFVGSLICNPNNPVQIKEKILQIIKSN
jgi:predicted component of viral defense system (DUF524 family)